MSKKPSASCDIAFHIEQVDPTLYAILSQTCAIRSVVTSKNSTGTTFVMPHKALREKIIKLASTGSAEDLADAADILNAHIFRLPIASGADFMTHKANLPNSLYPSQKVGVKSAAKNKVEFDSGAVAELDESFVQMASKDNPPKRRYYIWQLKSGEIPVTRDKPADPIKNTVVKSGAYDVPKPYSAQSNRFKIGITVENEYMLNALQCLVDPQQRLRAVYADYVCGLLKYLLENDVETLATVYPLVSGSNLDFYMLVEPHRQGNCLISEEYISAWWMGSRKASASVHEECRSVLRARPEACFADPAGVQNAIDEIHRSGFQESAKSADAVISIYNKFIDSNKLGSIANVLPDTLINYYRSEPGLKLRQDEARFFCHERFKQFERQPFDRANFDSLLNTIGDYLVDSGRAKIITAYFRTLIMPTIEIDVISKFVNSVAFMYMNHMGVELDLHTTASQAEIDGAIYDPFIGERQRHERLIVELPSDQQQLIEALRGLNDEKVDALIKKYM